MGRFPFRNRDSCSIQFNANEWWWLALTRMPDTGLPGRLGLVCPPRTAFQSTRAIAIVRFAPGFSARSSKDTFASGTCFRKPPCNTNPCSTTPAIIKGALNQQYPVSGSGSDQPGNCAIAFIAAVSSGKDILSLTARRGWSRFTHSPCDVGQGEIWREARRKPGTEKAGDRKAGDRESRGQYTYFARNRGPMLQLASPTQPGDTTPDQLPRDRTTREITFPLAA